MPKSGQKEVDIPAVVTFTSGAALLVDLGMADTMTREGIRKIAKIDPNWPFGEGRPFPYGRVSNAQTMDSGPFLDFFRGRETKKRGPDRQPRTRKPKGEPS